MGDGRKSPLDVAHPIFRPFWRRAVLTALILGWAAFELINSNIFWAILFGAAGVHLFVQFFLKFDPADYTPRDKDPS